MYSSPERVEINHHTIKLIVGIIALSLATLTSWLSETTIQSISASYHEGGWPRNIFVGFLFAISAFLLAYNGKSTKEMVLSKVAAIAAIGVAMFPCKCGSYPQIIPGIHAISAAIMFGILAVFCYIFYQRAYVKKYVQAKARAYVYAICGVAIVTSMLIITLDNILNGAISSYVPRLTFYGEATGLISFGIAWLIASQNLPFITNKDERLPFSPFVNGKDRQSDIHDTGK